MCVCVCACVCVCTCVGMCVHVHGRVHVCLRMQVLWMTWCAANLKIGSFWHDECRGSCKLAKFKRCFLKRASLKST